RRRPEAWRSGEVASRTGVSAWREPSCGVTRVRQPLPGTWRTRSALSPPTGTPRFPARPRYDQSGTISSARKGFHSSLTLGLCPILADAAGSVRLSVSIGNPTPCKGWDFVKQVGPACRSGLLNHLVRDSDLGTFSSVLQNPPAPTKREIS